MQAIFSANSLVMITARVPQIIKNFRDRSTGQLSSITTTINVVGCIVRIFTSMQDGATALLRQFVIGEGTGARGCRRRGGGAALPGGAWEPEEPSSSSLQAPHGPE